MEKNKEIEILKLKKNLKEKKNNELKIIYEKIKNDIYNNYFDKYNKINDEINYVIKDILKNIAEKEKIKLKKEIDLKNFQIEYDKKLNEFQIERIKNQRFKK